MHHCIHLCNHPKLIFHHLLQPMIWHDHLLPVAHPPLMQVSNRRKKITATPRVRNQRRERLRGSLFLCMILPFLQLSPLLLPPLRVAPPLHQLLLSACPLLHQARAIMPRSLTTPPQEPKTLVNFYTRAASRELKESRCIISSRICRHPGVSKDLYSLPCRCARPCLLSLRMDSLFAPVLFNLFTLL